MGRNGPGRTTQRETGLHRRRKRDIVCLLVLCRLAEQGFKTGEAHRRLPVSSLPRAAADGRSHYVGTWRPRQGLPASTTTPLPLLRVSRACLLLELWTGLLRSWSVGTLGLLGPWYLLLFQVRYSLQKLGCFSTFLCPRNVRFARLGCLLRNI